MTKAQGNPNVQIPKFAGGIRCGGAADVPERGVHAASPYDGAHPTLPRNAAFRRQHPESSRVNTAFRSSWLELRGQCETSNAFSRTPSIWLRGLGGTIRPCGSSQALKRPEGRAPGGVRLKVLVSGEHRQLYRGRLACGLWRRLAASSSAEVRGTETVPEPAAGTAALLDASRLMREALSMVGPWSLVIPWTLDLGHWSFWCAL